MKNIRYSLLIFLLWGCSSIKTPLPTNNASTSAPENTQSVIISTATQPVTQRYSFILDRFIDMDIAESESVWAVSDDGTVVHSDIFYREGRRKSIENFGGYLTGIDMISNTDGWAIAGINGIMYWNGNTWEKYLSADLSKTTPLLDIDFVDENSGWIVGCDFDKGDASSVLLYWNGTKWDKISLHDFLGRDIFCLTAVDAISESEVWIVGKDTYPKNILLHWDGSKWGEVPPPDDMRYPHTISGTGNNDVWVSSMLTADSEIIFHWNGENWTQFELPIAHSLTFAQKTSALFANSPNDVWAGGKQLFHWDGKDWKNKNYDGSNGNIVAIKSAPDKTIWALTDTGVVIKLVK